MYSVYAPRLGIHDILVLIQIHGSILLTTGSGSESDSRSDSRSDSFLQWTRMKKIVFHFFSYNLLAVTTSVLKFFSLKFALKVYFASIISVRSTPLWEKGRIRIRTYGSGRHKNMRIRTPNTGMHTAQCMFIYLSLVGHHVLPAVDLAHTSCWSGLLRPACASLR